MVMGWTTVEGSGSSVTRSSGGVEQFAGCSGSSSRTTTKGSRSLAGRSGGYVG